MIAVDLLLLWVACFGMWPIADPGHDLRSGSVLIVIDLTLHWFAVWALLDRWKIVRRNPKGSRPS